MHSFYSKSLQTVKRSFLIGWILLSVSSCQYIPFNIPFFKKPPPEETSEGANHKKASKISRIYIQNFSGQKAKEVQDIFFSAASEQKNFSFMELLPNDLTQLGVLRIDVIDYNIWEVDEKVSDMNDYPAGSIKAGDTIKRTNAIVSLKVNLFEAQTGLRLVTRQFSQPFQQIYIGEEAINNRPDSQIELDRLTKMLIFNMLDSFLSVEEEMSAIQYEKGLAFDWFAKKVRNFGNFRIRKGIRFAKAGKLDEAIWIWKIILFSPDKNMPEDVYLVNRASTYYNLGVAYQLKKEWWKAAEMFSSANRIRQKLKYAQAWGNSVQTWLETQRHPKPDKKSVSVVKTDIKPVELKDGPAPHTIRNFEDNNQLLLKPRVLWPLDPYLKRQQQQIDQNKLKNKTP